MDNRSKLNIPERITVGFQKRNDTYTKKLAYVTYYRKKGSNVEIAKENSWRGWIREKDYPIEDYDNKPTEGFVLNKNVGGTCSGWNHRNPYCRVYDPRGFEFEISFENLLFILQECDCQKGKGLSGEFVYAWDGKDLVLLPTSSSDYSESKKHKDSLEKITSKNIEVGSSYRGKEFDEMIYLGRKRMAYIRWADGNKGGGYKYEVNNMFLFYIPSDNKVKCYKSLTGLIYYKTTDGSMGLPECSEIMDKVYTCPLDDNFNKEFLSFNKRNKFVKDEFIAFTNGDYRAVKCTADKFKSFCNAINGAYRINITTFIDGVYHTYIVNHIVDDRYSVLDKVLVKKFGYKKGEYDFLKQINATQEEINSYKNSQECYDALVEYFKTHGRLEIMEVSTSYIDKDTGMLMLDAVTNEYNQYLRTYRGSYIKRYCLYEFLKLIDEDNTYVTECDLSYSLGTDFNFNMASGIYNSNDISATSTNITIKL